MYEKKWTIADENGRPPTAEQAELLVKWITHKAHRPLVGARFDSDGCVLTFEEGERRPTFADMELVAKQAARASGEMKSVLSMLRLAAGAGDMATIKRILGV